MTHEEHRAMAEEQLAEAERVFPDERIVEQSDLLYSKAAHLRQCAVAHAILSQK